MVPVLLALAIVQSANLDPLAQTASVLTIVLVTDPVTLAHALVSLVGLAPTADLERRLCTTGWKCLRRMQPTTPQSLKVWHPILHSDLQMQIVPKPQKKPKPQQLGGTAWRSSMVPHRLNRDALSAAAGTASATLLHTPALVSPGGLEISVISHAAKKIAAIADFALMGNVRARRRFTETFVSTLDVQAIAPAMVIVSKARASALAFGAAPHAQSGYTVLELCAW